MVSPSTEPGLWFDGQSATRRAVTVGWVAGELELCPAAAAPRRYAPASLQPGPCWYDGPCAVALPDGGTLWLTWRPSAPGPVTQQLLAATRRPGLIEKAMRSTRVAVLAALCTTTLLAWLDQRGMGWAAENLVTAMPRSVDVALGQSVFKTMDRTVLVPSRAVPTDRQQRLQARWQAAAAVAAPGLPCRLYFRDLKASPNAFNAFALPDGSVVLLDGLTKALGDEEVLAVLGHELGHVVHRHGLKGAAKVIGLSSAAQVAIGDFSSLVAGLGSTLQVFRHSRDQEREADAFIPVFLAAAGLPPEVERTMWLKFRSELARRGAADRADWLSTHPSADERIQSATRRP